MGEPFCKPHPEGFAKRGFRTPVAPRSPVVPTQISGVQRDPDVPLRDSHIGGKNAPHHPPPHPPPPLPRRPINGLRLRAANPTLENRNLTNLVFALGSTGLSLAPRGTVDRLRSARECPPLFPQPGTLIPADSTRRRPATIASFRHVDFAFRIDTLSCTMLLIVTWIGFLIHVLLHTATCALRGYTRFLQPYPQSLHVHDGAPSVLERTTWSCSSGGNVSALLVTCSSALLRQELSPPTP